MGGIGVNIGAGCMDACVRGWHGIGCRVRFFDMSMMRLLRVGDDVHRFNIPFAETK